MNTQKHSFTLAEVLITLTIIGVIAVLTIPNLIYEYKKVQTEAKFKQFYSMMSNAFKLYMLEKGCSDLHCAGFEKGNSENIIDFTKKQLKAQKAVYGCVAAPAKTVTLDKGKPPVWYGYSYPLCDTSVTALLENGMIIGFAMWHYGGFTSPADSKYTALNVDLNGVAPPNRIGYDIFYLSVNVDGKISAVDTIDANLGCQAPGETTGRRYGHACAARIIKNGWKIDYWD